MAVPKAQPVDWTGSVNPLREMPLPVVTSALVVNWVKALFRFNLPAPIAQSRACVVVMTPAEICCPLSQPGSLSAEFMSTALITSLRVAASVYEEENAVFATLSRRAAPPATNGAAKLVPEIE